MMVHHVRPWHLYSRDGTCTSDDLCRIPLSLVAFHIFYLLDRASIYEISVLMTRFQCTIRCLHSVWRSYFTVYYTWWWSHVTYVYYAYSWPLYYFVSRECYTSYLQSHAEIYHCIVLMSGWFFHLVLHYSTYGIGIMYFAHHFTPLASHISGHML